MTDFVVPIRSVAAVDCRAISTAKRDNVDVAGRTFATLICRIRYQTGGESVHVRTGGIANGCSRFRRLRGLPSRVGEVLP